jgi:alpha-glucosidase
MKGKQVPILVSEQGVGRGLEPISFALGLQSGNEFTTYAPLPTYIATAASAENTAAHAFMLRNTEYCVFDMTQDNKTFVDILRPTFGNGKSEPVVGTLFRSSRRRPLDLLHGITEYTGRMRSLPSWILRGAVIGLEGGTDQVTEILHTLRDHDVDVSALWLQDWSGVNVDNFGERVEWNWQLDSTRYPRWNELAQDVRLMTYINPYLANNMYGREGRNLFQEASELGYLIRNSTGHPYILASGTYCSSIALS